MKTAVRMMIEKIESEFSNASPETIIRVLKSYEAVQDEHLKTAYLHGKINARDHEVGSELNLGSEKYFTKNWNN